jgi:hypothetical protein
MSASDTLPAGGGRVLGGGEEGMVILVPQTLFQCNGWCLQRATGLASSLHLAGVLPAARSPGCAMLRSCC